MPRHHGRFGRVMMSTSHAGSAIAVGSLNSWDMDASADLVETTSFNDPNKTFVRGLRNAQGNFGGFWDDTDSTLFTGAQSIDGVNLYLYPDYQNNPEKYAYGPAWVDFSIATGVAAAVTIRAKWAANGPFYFLL